MKNFEYRTERIFNFADPAGLQDKLNLLAQEGWELDWVLDPGSLDVTMDEFIIMIFKREK